MRAKLNAVPRSCFFVLSTGLVLLAAALGTGGCERSNPVSPPGPADAAGESSQAGENSQSGTDTATNGNADPDRDQAPDANQDQQSPRAPDDRDAPTDWPDPEILEPDPAPLDGELATIFQLISRGRTGAARVRLVKFDKLNPDNGRSAFLFGLTYHQEQKYAKARPHFERAIGLEPSYSTTLYFYGWCLYYLGELDAARTAFELHLSAQPDTADSHFALGLINLDQANLEDAERRFKRAIELQRVDGVTSGELAERDQRLARNLSKAHTRLGDVYMRRQDLDQARTHFQTAVELFPGNYKTYYKLYRVLTRLGEDEAAQQALKRHNEISEQINPDQENRP